MYEIIFQKEAQKSLKKIPKEDIIKIRKKIAELEKNAIPKGSKSLKGIFSGYYRIRSGIYRIVYEIFQDKLIILVVKIAHRKEVYKEK